MSNHVSTATKEMNFELDLLPVISMMSVCICFLLLTAVWTQVGSLDVKQGLGQQSNRNAQNASSLWVTMQENGELKLQLMDSPSTPEFYKTRVFQMGNAQDSAALEAYVTEIRTRAPQLKTALILATKGVNYGSVIRVMDRLKMRGIEEVGLAPL